ncbi:MAG: beta-galactosidase [Oscillospiraceae bacterium]|nr:beta-galactosidase [Oscillospiraceae bacterium]
MRNFKITIFFTLCFIAFTVFFAGCSGSSNKEDKNKGNNVNKEDNNESVLPEEITVNPVKTDEPVINPGMGWILYGDPSNQTPETLALSSTGYMRFSWSDLNPEEGVYNWSIIDNAIENWKNCGKQFAFGVMSVNTSGAPKQIPDWIFDKGMQYTMGKGESSDDLSFYIPVWNDPVYIEECAKFAEALAEKYDGNPDIAFIDIRNFGNWGENHLYPFEATSVFISDDDLKKLWQPYIDNFKKTQLAICCNGSDDKDKNVEKWAVDNGVTYRRDGLMGKIGWGGSNGDELSYAFGKLPVIWEFFGSFRSLENSADRKWNDDEFIENIKNNQPTYIGMGQWGDDAAYMLSKKEDLIKQAANMMGYHFTVVQAKYMNIIDSGQDSNISVSIENSGVTRIFTDCIIKLTLLNEYDAEVSGEIPTDWDAKSFSPGTITDLSANINFSAEPGDYRIAIGFFSDVGGNPTYNIGNSVKTKNNWYILGNISVK